MSGGTRVSAKLALHGGRSQVAAAILTLLEYAAGAYKEIMDVLASVYAATCLFERVRRPQHSNTGSHLRLL